jgi:hypothetical protein
MTRTRIDHDPHVCDLCGSNDVEQPSELVTGNGWYGGVKILWGGRGNHPRVVAVMCRSCRDQHDEAYWQAERRAVEVDGNREWAYYCPAHKRDHLETALDIEMREAQYAEVREFLG